MGCDHKSVDSNFCLKCGMSFWLFAGGQKLEARGEAGDSLKMLELRAFHLYAMRRSGVRTFWEIRDLMVCSRLGVVMVFGLDVLTLSGRQCAVYRRLTGDHELRDRFLVVQPPGIRPNKGVEQTVSRLKRIERQLQAGGYTGLSPEARKETAVALVSEGFSVRQAAAVVGYSHEAVRQEVRKELDRIEREGGVDATACD